MSADRLTVGDWIHCQHCPKWHQAEAPTGNVGTPYAASMLFVICGDNRYYVGHQGQAARDPRRVLPSATQTSG